MAAKLVLLAALVSFPSLAVSQSIRIGYEGPVFTVEANVNLEACVVIREGATNGRQFVLSYSTRDSDATAGMDYVDTSGTLTFNDASGTRLCFQIPILDDNVAEVDTECLVMELTAVGAPADLDLTPFEAIACISDNDEGLRVMPEFVQYNFDEDDGMGLICVDAIDLSGPLLVQYSTRGDPDISGTDYIDVSGIFSFTTLETRRCVSITINDDLIDEPVECFEFILTTPTNVPNPQPITQVCIIDNDDVITPTSIRVGFQPSLRMVDENVAPSENFQVCLRLLDGTLLATQSVRLEIVLTQGAGDAVLGTDFDQVSPNPFPIVFDIDNQDQALCAPVDIIDNLIFEEEESFFAIVRESSGNNVPVELDPSIARIIIIDDERRPTTEPPTTEEPTDFMPDPMGPGVGDDPHFAIFLPSGRLLCYTVQGEHGFAFNLISNAKIHMNALFVPDARREEVTWIGSLGIVVQDTHFQGSNTTRIRFESKLNEIHINDKVTLEAKNIEAITFHSGKMVISEGPMLEEFRYPSVRVNLDDLRMSFTVNFTGEHLDMMWHKLEENENSHGLIGQFFRKGVEIDPAAKLLHLPNKDPVPVMRKPVWAYMEHNVPSDQLCWVAMNPGYQGNHLIDGHYLDYVVDSVLSTDFKFECKHKDQKNHHKKH